MKTPAIIASLTVASAIAFAAGQQSSGKRSSAMPSGAQAHSVQEEMPQARMAQAATGCPPPIAADLNTDGQVDGADLTILLASWGPIP